MTYTILVFRDHKDSMPDTGESNIELPHHLSELQREFCLGLGGNIWGFAEALVLAAVAVVTAWSGYQEARSRDIRRNGTVWPTDCM